MPLLDKHKSLYHHFLDIHKSDLDVNITVVEQCHDTRERLASENGWIQRLDTLLPRGLNTKSNLN